MFPLPPGEAAVIAEIFRLFPGTREVTEGSQTMAAPQPRVDELAGQRLPSVTSQASIFDEEAA